METYSRGFPKDGIMRWMMQHGPLHMLQLIECKAADLFIFQDPNCWTRDHIIKVDKVLFVVPGKPEAESITPIRNQWMVALNYLSGHHSTIRQVTRKVAVVILPSSGNVPCEVSKLQLAHSV